MVLNNIKKFRKEKGLTLVQLGEVAGLTEPSVRRAERNMYTVKFSTLQKIADALDVTIKDLFNEKAEFNDTEIEIYRKNKMLDEMTIDK